MWIVHYPKRKYQFVLKLINFVNSRHIIFIFFLEIDLLPAFVCFFVCVLYELEFGILAGVVVQVKVSHAASKDVMQGKLFQKCTHLLYFSVLSLGANVNTRRMSKPDMGSIFHIKKLMN